MKILVTGGAGYMGSDMVRELLEREHEVVILDNLSTGSRRAVEALGVSDRLIVGDIADEALLDQLFTEHRPQAVIHFAASKRAAESMQNPSKYFRNNFYGTLALLDAMVKYNVKYLVFSSSGAVFGTPDKCPVSEDNLIPHPESPYGESKLMVENALKWYDRTYGLKSVSLRYFNVAGAAPDGRIGEDWSVSQNFIPVALKAALGVVDQVSVFGTDYPTRDGSCIRDYIHVTDLSVAHIYALEYLMRTNQSTVYNLGTGQGHTVKEVIALAKQISGVDFQVVEGPRRPGDPVAIWADSSRAERELGWKAQYTLEDMVRTAYNWHRQQLEVAKAVHLV